MVAEVGKDLNMENLQTEENIHPLNGQQTCILPNYKNTCFHNWLNYISISTQNLAETSVLSTQHKEFVPSLMDVMSPALEINEVRLFVVNKNIDVVYITENWLTNSVDSSHLHIPEYNIICKNHTAGINGGVSLCRRNSISFTILD